MSTVQVENVYKVFGRRPHEAVERMKAGTPREEIKDGRTVAVMDASFEVAEGEIFVVMGLSGSGKSTLLRMLNGLVDPTAGRVLVDGEDVTTLRGKGLRRLRAEKLSMVFQHFALFPHHTVLENAAFGLEVQGVSRTEREAKAQTALERVGLGERASSYPGELSGGMQQRVGLARAFATDADILLMDEAFSALDPLIRREMQELLLELQQETGKTIVFITHDLNEAMRLGDRVAVMRDGRVVQVGTAEEILNDPANDYVASFVADVDRTRVLTAASVMEEPAARVSVHDGPREALRVMRTHQVSSAFVCSGDRTLVGTLSEDAAAAAVRAGEKRIGQVLTDDVATVSPDTPVADVFPLAVDSTVPVAVITENRRLLGVIPRAALLAAVNGAEVAVNA